MDYTYVASGGLEFIGCGYSDYTKNVITRFHIGEIVCLLGKARGGKLVKIRIKKINLVNQYDYNYQDTQNRIWKENELCDLEFANLMIENYIRWVERRAGIAAKNC